MRSHSKFCTGLLALCSLCLVCPNLTQSQTDEKKKERISVTTDLGNETTQHQLTPAELEKVAANRERTSPRIEVQKKEEVMTDLGTPATANQLTPEELEKSALFRVTQPPPVEIKKRDVDVKTDLGNESTPATLSDGEKEKAAILGIEIHDGSDGTSREFNDIPQPRVTEKSKAPPKK